MRPQETTVWCQTRLDILNHLGEDHKRDRRTNKQNESALSIRGGRLGGNCRADMQCCKRNTTTDVNIAWYTQDVCIASVCRKTNYSAPQWPPVTRRYTHRRPAWRHCHCRRRPGRWRKMSPTNQNNYSTSRAHTVSTAMHSVRPNLGQGW